jgi:endonuclease-3
MRRVKDKPAKRLTRPRHLPGTQKSANEVRAICEILEATYHSPRHGNLDDPLDELFFIILSTRTRDESYRKRFGILKDAVGDWSRLNEMPAEEIEEILRPGGLGTLKAAQIRGIAKYLRDAFGTVTLHPLTNMGDDEAMAILMGMRGVAAKVAKCVLMYSLGRPVLPVDVHVHRVASRLGFSTKRRPDTSQDLIEAAIPAELRYSFHVNAVAHGRTLCLPRLPRCESCPLTSHCNYFMTTQLARRDS